MSDDSKPASDDELIADTKVVSEALHRIPDTTVTVCVMTLANGKHFVAESHPDEPEQFDAGVGERVARARAHMKVRPLQQAEIDQKRRERLRKMQADAAEYDRRKAERKQRRVDMMAKFGKQRKAKARGA